MRKSQLAIAGFKDGRMPQAKEYEQPTEARKDKSEFFPELPKRNSALSHLDFSLFRRIADF